MMMWRREITIDQALAVRQILVEECGYHVWEHDSFAETIRTDDGREDWKVCREYRFIGALGFGGKFRNNGNNDNTPYIDCYREDETPKRLAMIRRANARLAVLFSPIIPPQEGKT